MSCSSSSAATPCKILVLHELGTNGLSMRRRLRHLEGEMKALYQHFTFVYADGPYMLPATEEVTLPGVGKKAKIRIPQAKQFRTMEDGDQLRHLIQRLSYSRGERAEELSNSLCPQREAAKHEPMLKQKLKRPMLSPEDLAMIPRAETILDASSDTFSSSRLWTLPTDKEYWGGEEYSLRYLWSILETQGPFHGAIGVSSGSFMIQYLQAMLVSPSIRSQLPLCGQVAQEPFKFVMHMAPFFPTRPHYNYFIRASRHQHTRALIVYGVNDQVLRPNACQYFADEIGAGEIWLHEGGHGVPSDAKWACSAARWCNNAAIGKVSPSSHKSATDRLASL